MCAFQIGLKGDDILQVEEGDHYGFSWLDFGTVTFAYTADHYCENMQLFNVGDTANLVSGRYGNRDYSLRLFLEPSCGATPTSCS